VTTTPDVPKPEASGGRGWLVTPVIVFIAIAALFAIALQTGDPSKLPSAFIGKRAPALQLSALEGLSDGKPIVPLDMAMLSQGHVSVVNFWASWCTTCVAEHPLLLELKKRTGAETYGINYKDNAADAVRFLGRYGNPYSAIGVDGRGHNAIEWGVYGTPETFVLNGKGEIVYKHVGPISEESLVSKVIPAVEAAKTSSAPRKG
jgi:cytochrome c biogenesis protein CcmG/thiol:disulfide interchange protein DsbE